jgi:MFS transporter, DHA3 family, macrolide efflux protein
MFNRELLAIKPFRDLWLGQAISQLGDALYYLIFLFMVDRITGDARMVGISGVLATLPYLLFSLHAGVEADRRDRRGIMLFADVASAILLGAFAVLVFFDPTPHVVALMIAPFLLSLINVFFSPAKSAAIPSLVPSEKLLEANALSSATQNLMPLIGIGLSGTVLAALYAFEPDYFFFSAILLNGLSFFVSALFIRRLPRLLPEAEKGAERRQTNQWQDLKDGLSYLRRERVLLVLTALNALVQIMIAPFMVVYVAVNRAWFGGEYGTLALFEFSFFVGMIAGSMIVGKTAVKRAGMAYILGLFAVGLTIAAMAVSKTIPLMVFFNFAAGIALPFAQIPMTTYMQAIVPDAFRGRVNAVQTMSSMGIQPLGIGLGGLLINVVGPAWMFVIMGLGMGFAALVGLLDQAFRAARVPSPTESGGSSDKPAAPGASLATG